MPSTVLKLKRHGSLGWRLYLPNGNEFGPLFRGDTHEVRERARIFISTWYNWTVDCSECYSEGEIRDESKKDRVY